MESDDTQQPVTEGTVNAKVRRTFAIGRAARFVALAFLFVFFCVVGSCVVISLFGVDTMHWRAFDVEFSLKPALRGETHLIFAPLGQVRAATNTTPVVLNASLKSIAFDDMKKLVLSPPKRDALEREFKDCTSQFMRSFSKRIVLLGALGALLIPLFLHSRKIRYWLLAALVGAGFTGYILFATVRGYDMTAFNNPTYTGSLKEAEWIIALVKEGFNNAEALSDKLKRVADNLDVIYGRINAVPGLAADVDTIKVLHISDIHNNVAAIDFIHELTSKMKVDVVVNTGDLTDFGLPIETQITKAMKELNAPMVFIAGNHDSQATIEAVRHYPNTTILDGKPITVAGLSFLGNSDPSSNRASTGSVDTPDDQLVAAGRQLLEAYNAAPIKPDIVCVHNPREADALVGVVDLILCGHVHRSYIDVGAKTVICNAGTTGAAGARYIDQREGVPFTAAILYFTKKPVPRLLFIDQIMLDGSLGQYSITRKSFGGLVTPTENGAKRLIPRP